MPPLPSDNKRKEDELAAYMAMVADAERRTSFSGSQSSIEPVEPERESQPGPTDYEDCPTLAIILKAIGVVLMSVGSILTDVFESLIEIRFRQRIISNFMHLTMTGAMLFGFAFAATAVFASNPVGAALLFTGLLVGALAMLVSVSKKGLHHIDAIMKPKSALEGDSRFRLSAKEKLKIIKRYKEPQKAVKLANTLIDKMTDRMKKLNLHPSYSSSACFWHKPTASDEYAELMQDLRTVKKGSLTIKITEKYLTIEERIELTSQQHSSVPDEKQHAQDTTSLDVP